MAELSKEAQYVVTVFRSLCTSRKFPASVRILVKEYKEMEGDFPPKCGFATVDELLRESGQFDFVNYQGQTCLKARASAETAHIVEMLKAQKVKRKRTNTSFGGIGRGRYVSSFAGRPLPPRANYRPITARPQTRTMNNNNIFMARNSPRMPPPLRRPAVMVPQLTLVPPMPVVSTTPIQRTAPVNATPPMFVSAPAQQTARTPGILPSQRTRIIIPTTVVQQQQPPPEVVVPPVFQRQPSFRDTQPGNGGGGELRAVRSTPAVAYETESSASSEQQRNTRNFTHSNGKTETMLLKRNNSGININNGNSNSNNNSVRQFPPRPSVQGRLEIARQSSTETRKLSATNDAINKVFAWENERLSNIEKLSAYCKVRGVPEPKYTLFRVRDGKQIKHQCQVTVDDSIYSSYPEDFYTAEEARLFAATQAVERLKESQSKENHEVFSGTNEELLVVLFNCLSGHPAGIFMSEIPAVIQAEKNFTLPDHYEQLIIQNSESIFRIETNIGKNIVFAIPDAFVHNPTKLLINYPEPPPIQLPWHSTTWSLYCTYVASSSEVWCQLFGEEFKTKFDAMSVKMENFELYVPAADFKENKFYIAIVNTQPQRVRLMELQADAKKASCFCIDSGEEIMCDFEELFVCDLEFLQLPGQAVMFSLNGLEIFENMPEMSSCAQEMLQEKAFVGIIKISRDDYEHKCSVLADATIEVEMWDTSNDEDVNLNLEILRIARPSFPRVKISSEMPDRVVITGVADNGEISGYHNNSRAIEMIRQVINEIKSRGFPPSARGLYENEQGNLYLVYDEMRREFLRAESFNIIDSNHLLMRLVDRGTVARIAKANIYRLAELHAGLNIFPPQGLRFRLHKTVAINDTSLKILRGLVKPESEGVMKLKATGTDGIPEVRLLVLSSRQNMAVNDALLEQVKIQASATVDTEMTNQFKSINIKSPAEQIIQPKHETPSTGKSLKPQLSIPNPKIPEVGNYLEVRVLQSQTPKLFYVHTSRCSKDFYAMMDDLQRHGRSNSVKSIHYDQIEEEQVYAALRKDRKWCRVKILKKFDEKHISVKFIDFVTIDVVSPINIKILPQEFRKIPEQALFAKLHGVKPVTGESYSSAAAYRFKALTEDKTFSSMIMAIEETDDESLIVTLEMVDPTSMRNLSRILIEEGHAIEDPPKQ